MPTASTRRCACAWAGARSSDFSAITTSPTWSALSTAAWTPVAAADDLYRRLRAIGERVQIGRPLTVSLILDGENAWEYYPGNGREFLRQFYRRIDDDPDIRPLTASEALEAAGEIAHVDQASFPAPGSTPISTSGSATRRTSLPGNLLRDARDFYAARREKSADTRRCRALRPKRKLAAAFDALLAAEGSDWCWWFGPEHSSANDAEFDAFFRKLLSEVYRSLGAEAPDELAEPIKRQPERAEVLPPSSYLNVNVDGRETSYFEWLGAGLYSPQERESSMHGRVARCCKQIRYGFSDDQFYVRVDVFDGVFARLRDAEFRMTYPRTRRNCAWSFAWSRAKLTGYLVEARDFCLLGPDEMVKVACDRILEVSVARKLLRLRGRNSISMVVALWEGGLPVDLLPAEGWLEVQFGAENFAWPPDQRNKSASPQNSMIATSLGRDPTGIIVSRLAVRTRITARSLDSRLATRSNSPLGSRPQAAGCRPTGIADPSRRVPIAIGTTRPAAESER